VLCGRPAVFLSCSEKFKEQLAVPIRAALRDLAVYGVIVSDEPLLPRARSDPDGKVNSYLDASDALVALCTPDDELSDGTIQARQNVIDEIQRARSRPGLRDKIQILKAPAVRLPSNIDPTYDALDVDNLSATVEVIVRQLRAWGVLAREPERPRSTSTDQREETAQDYLAQLKVAAKAIHDAAEGRVDLSHAQEELTRLSRPQELLRQAFGDESTVHWVARLNLGMLRRAIAIVGGKRDSSFSVGELVELGVDEPGVHIFERERDAALRTKVPAKAFATQPMYLYTMGEDGAAACASGRTTGAALGGAGPLFQGDGSLTAAFHALGHSGSPTGASSVARPWADFAYVGARSADPRRPPCNRRVARSRRLAATGPSWPGLSGTSSAEPSGQQQRRCRSSSPTGADGVRRDRRGTTTRRVVARA
jgi:hypothetical protein